MSGCDVLQQSREIVREKAIIYLDSIEMNLKQCRLAIELFHSDRISGGTKGIRLCDVEAKYSTLTKLLAASQKLKGTDTTDNSANEWMGADTLFGAHFSIANYSKSRLRIFIYSIPL